MILRRYLIIRNGTETRLTHRRPELAPNEVCIEIVIKVPQPPRYVSKIEIELPEPPPVFVEAEVMPYPDNPALEVEVPWVPTAEER